MNVRPEPRPASLEDTVARLRAALRRPLPGLSAQLRMAPDPRPDTERILEPDLDCRQAAVLALLYPGAEGVSLVLTRRTDRVETHRGQISFPGGSLDPGETAEVAALREAQEELGVEPGELAVLGKLSPLYIPHTGFCVTPVVAYSRQRLRFTPNLHEVAEVIEAPLIYLLAPATCCEETWYLRGAPAQVPYYAIGAHKVWGATAMMLSELLALLNGEITMEAIMIYEYGGPEVLKLEERPTPSPGPGQALVRVAAAGVNFVEIYQRMGWYKISLPGIPGGEGAGIVLEVGTGVEVVQPGDRVAFMNAGGTYATHTLIAADRLAPVPETLSLEEAAASMVQGITAHVLATRTYPIKPGDRVLVHAAAGGVGRLLCQIAKMQGATVYGTVSTEAKAQVARDAGADETILYTKEDFAAAIKRLTGGKGVNVVYDSVGKDTFDGSLDSLAPLGYMVLYGQSSGFPPLLDIQRLAGARSLFLTRPSVFPYVSTREDLLHHAEAVFDLIIGGKLKLHIDRTYPLAQAADAQIALASRQTVGKLLLIP